TFDVKIKQKVVDGVTYAYPSRAPKVPNELAGLVTDVAGLGRTLTGTGSAPASAPAETDVQCPGLSEAIAKMVSISGVDTLQSAGIDGKGVTLAVLEVAEVSQASLDAAKSCSGMAIPPVTSTLVGTTQSSDLIPNSSEPVLDVLAASALAPGLDGIVVYQFDPYSSMVFPLAAAIGDALAANGPDVMSTSVGVCEATLMPGDASIAEWFLAVGAVGGLTTVASSGDTGSSGCAPANQSEAAQYPATSAYATAVGGTAVVAGSGGQQQAVWNASGYAGGGAQTSTLPRPWYQSSVPGPSNRIVPDVSAVAAPTQFPPIPICIATGCSLQQVGGTSAAAPLVAAGLALVLQDIRQQRGSQTLRLGLANPVLYSLASGGGSTALSDVTQG
ncbi:MAG: S8 family serine peptidase, partial [Actinomycetales bacterium]